MNKSKDSPGVWKYKWNKPFEIRGYSRQRSRRSGYMDEVEWLSKEVPGHKYKIDYSTVLERSPN